MAPAHGASSYIYMSSCSDSDVDDSDGSEWGGSNYSCDGGGLHEGHVIFASDSEDSVVDLQRDQFYADVFRMTPTRAKLWLLTLAHDPNFHQFDALSAALQGFQEEQDIFKTDSKDGAEKWIAKCLNIMENLEEDKFPEPQCFEEVRKKFEEVRKKLACQSTPPAMAAIQAHQLLRPWLLKNKPCGSMCAYDVCHLIADAAMMLCRAECNDPTDREEFLQVVAVAYGKHKDFFDKDFRHCPGDRDFLAQINLSYHKNRENKERGFMSNNRLIALATGRRPRAQRVRSRRKQKEKEEKKEQEANEEKQNASASSQSAPVDAAKKEEKEETEANEEKMNLSEKKNLSTSFQSAPSSALDAPITISLAPMTKLFLGGLSQKTTTKDLEDHFSKFAGMLREYPSPLLIGYPWNHKLDIFRSRSICESCPKIWDQIPENILHPCTH